MPTNRRIVLASRPQGAATTSNFRLEEVPVPALLMRAWALEWLLGQLPVQVAVVQPELV